MVREIIKKDEVLLTGAAGFIGMHVAEKLLKKLIGIDNLNKYYDVNLKRRIKKIKKIQNFSFVKVDISNSQKLKNYLKNLNLML